MDYFVGHYFDESNLPSPIRKKGALFVSGTEKMRFNLTSGSRLEHGELYVVPYQADDKEEIKSVWGEVKPFKDARGAAIDNKEG